MALYKIEKDASGAPTGETTLVSGGTLYASAPIGTIFATMAESAPSGFLMCDGTAYSATDYPELWAILPSTVKDTTNNTFTIDLRETTLKGAGLTGETVGAHLDADGLQLGEFLDDRVQTHNHTVSVNSSWMDSAGVSGGGNINLKSYTYTTTSNSGRSGATTETKSRGVNFIIKAKMVAIPSDFLNAVDEAVEESMAGGIKDIKIKNVNISTQAFTNGMNLATNVDSELDSGYEFVAFTSYASVGWTVTSPLYFANPNVKAGIPCISDISTIPTQSGLSFAFFFLEIKRY